MSKLSNALSEVLKNRRFWVVASTDLNHYENHEETLIKDKMVMDAISKRNVELLYEVITKNGITMCGYGAVATLLNLKVGKVEILNHSTSGEVSGDYDSEVGYMAACVC